MSNIRIININQNQPREGIIAFVPFGSPDLEVQVKDITKYCTDNNINPYGIIVDSDVRRCFDDCYCKTIIVTSLTKLSYEVEKLTQILIELERKRVNVIPIEQSHLLWLWDWDYLCPDGKPRSVDRVERDCRNVAEQVLSGNFRRKQG